MNWTGSGLSRSRFAKGSLTAKQKNYFAKARSKLQHGCPPPPEIQFFEFGEWMPERKALEFSPHHAIKGGSSPRQKTLDQFETIKPLVKKLESLQERREPQKRKRTPLEEIRKQARSKTWKLQTEEPIIISSDSKASSASYRDSPAAIHSSSSEDTLNMPSIEMKRRRLLEKDDWMGLNRPATKPVKMKFADPADTDLIGKRRRIGKNDYRHLSNRSRPVMREAVPVERPHETPQARGQYYPEEDISVRIGSAVDRSDGRASLKDNTRLSILSDELLDGEFPQFAYETQPLAPVFNTPGPAPIRLSEHGYREVLTPSAYMTDSSSAGRVSDRVDHLRRYRQASSPVRMDEKFTSNGIDELHEWAVPSAEQEQAQEPSFRLVYKDTPRPCAQRLKGQGSSSNVPELTFAKAKHPLELPVASPAFERVPWNKIEIRNVRNPQYPRSDSDRGNTDLRAERLANVVPQLVMAASESPDSTNVDHDQLHSDPKVETLSITTPPSAMASAQILTEFQNCMASNARLENGITRTLQDMEKRFAQETGKALAPTPRRKDPQAMDRLRQLQHHSLQTASELEGSMRDLTERHPTEGKTKLLQPSLRAATTTGVQQRPAEPSVAAQGESQMSRSATEEKKALRVVEDEEAAWRKIVFGDDQDSNEHTFEEPEASSQAPSSSNHPLLTQPSLLAEAATSPLKQNPHLADLTFDILTSPAAFRSPTQTYTEKSRAEYSTSSPLPMPPPTYINPPTPVQPRLPRTLIQNPLDSSLLGEASSPSHLTPSHNILSSDELQRPPERLPEFPGNSRGQSQLQERRGPAKTQERKASGTQTDRQGGTLPKERVMFKKPTPYVGTYSSDLVAPLVLGERVLRSGRRVGHIGPKGAKEKRKVNGKGKIRLTEYEDEHERDLRGDDDDIVDD